MGCLPLPKMQSPSSRRAWIEIPWPGKEAVPRRVALLAEGVDRNHICTELLQGGQRSPSSRRAWIEIGAEGRRADVPAVALLAEGVDRNQNVYERLLTGMQSRPPRGGRG